MVFIVFGSYFFSFSSLPHHCYGCSMSISISIQFCLVLVLYQVFFVFDRSQKRFRFCDFYERHIKGFSILPVLILTFEKRTQTMVKIRYEVSLPSIKVAKDVHLIKGGN